MKLISSLMLATALSFSAGAALAACPDPGSDPTTTAGISKDGTHAPLEAPKTEAEQLANKDGKTMPLATEEGGGDKNLATSQQDVEAQQHGDKTAAAQAEDDACKD